MHFSRKAALISLLSVSTFLHADNASSELNLNIGIGVNAPPPNVVIAVPPAVIAIPGAPIWFAPDMGVNLFFHSGSWYLFQDTHWYMSPYYKGPWRYLPPKRVPVVFNRIPRDYHRVAYGKKHIPYGQFKKHWREWERDHYRGPKDHGRKGRKHGHGGKWKDD
jgi:hypothetical protein